MPPSIHDLETDLESAPGTTPLVPLPVSELCALLKEAIAEGFPSFWIEGEVTGLNQHRNGHCYFNLRDETSSLRSVVWASTMARLKTVPQEGEKVIALGRLGLYPARGDLQLSISQILPSGAGDWQQQFEATLKKLSADGLMDPDRHRSLPLMPKTIAVLTSPSGAAWHDVLSVAHRRFPGLNILLVPATVQGADATNSLLKAFGYLNYLIKNPSMCPLGQIDAVMLTRGGGSREDLWPFNDEQVARAVASCPVPIVAAIGHETDITICELVADLRAPTPSAAAERLVPEVSVWQDRLRAAEQELTKILRDQVKQAHQSLADSSTSLTRLLGLRVERQGQKLASLSARLQALSPLNTLSRGYLLATTSDNRPLLSASSAQAEEIINLKWHDGVRQAKILPPAI